MTRGLSIPLDRAKPTKIDKSFWEKVFIRAVPHEEREIKNCDKYLTLMKDGQFGGVAARNTKNVSANFTFARVQIILALLHTHDPAIYSVPNERSSGSEQSFAPIVMAGLLPSLGDAKREFSQTIERWLRYSYSETSSKNHNEACLFEAVVRGLGYTKTSFDPIKAMDRIDTIRRYEMYVDPNARYSLNQASYVVQSSILPIEKARMFFEQRGVSPKTILPNHSLSKSHDVTSKEQAEHLEGQPDDLYKFYEIWNKADDGARQLMYWDNQKKGFISDVAEWPFELDHDEFCYEPLTFHRQFGQISDAFTSLHVVEGLRKGYEEMVEAMNRIGRRSIARKVVYDKKKFSPEDIRKLENAKDMEFVGVSVVDGKRVGDGIDVIDFNTQNDVTPELAGAFKRISDEVMGMDELLRGGEVGRMSATEASVRDENTKMRTNKMQGTVDSWLIQQLRHRAQIARQLVPAEKISNVTGMIGGLLWALHAGDGTDLTAEYSISIQAGSTGERSKRQKQEALNMKFERGMALNAAAMGLPVIDVIGIEKAIAELEGDLDPERFINPELAQEYSSGALMMPPSPEEETPVEEPVQY